MIRRRRFLGVACVRMARLRPVARKTFRPSVTTLRPSMTVSSASWRRREAIQRKLPGMVGAIVKGDAISAIGSIGIRKIGSNAAMKSDDLDPPRLVHQGHDGHDDRHLG